MRHVESSILASCVLPVVLFAACSSSESTPLNGNGANGATAGSGATGGTGGQGATALDLLGPASPGCETIDLCCGPKFACVAIAGGTPTNKLGQTFAEIKQALEDGLAGAPDPYSGFLPLAPIAKCP